MIHGPKWTEKKYRASFFHSFLHSFLPWVCCMFVLYLPQLLGVRFYSSPLLGSRSASRTDKRPLSSYRAVPDTYAASPVFIPSVAARPSKPVNVVNPLGGGLWPPPVPFPQRKATTPDPGKWRSLVVIVTLQGEERRGDATIGTTELLIVQCVIWTPLACWVQITFKLLSSGHRWGTDLAWGQVFQKSSPYMRTVPNRNRLDWI